MPFFRFGSVAVVWLLMALASAQEMRDVTFTADYDDTDQKYLLLLPGNFDSQKPHDVLIALHGHGSDRRQFMENPRGECRGTREIAAEYDMILVSPDYRATTSWMGPAAEADLVQIIAALKRNDKVKRVFLCGGSMGGTAALTFAAMHPELVAGVAAMNPTANLLEYERFQEAMAESFGGTKVDIPLEYKKRSAEYWPERLTMPIGVTVSGNDDLVPPDSAIRLVKILKQLQRDVLLVFREQAGHQTSLEDTRTILEFAINQAK